MRSFNLALGLFALPLAFAGDAPVVQNNPTGAQYIAKLPDKTNTSVHGAVVVEASANGTGTNVQVSISGLPAIDIGGNVGEGFECFKTPLMPVEDVLMTIYLVSNVHPYLQQPPSA